MKTARKQRRGRLISARREVAEQNRIRNGYERNLAKQLVTVFNRIGRRAGEQYQQGGLRTINRNQNTQDLAAVIIPSVRATMTAMIDRFQLVNPKQSPYERFIEQYINTQVGSHIQNIEATTMNQIRKAILEGTEQDLGPEPISRLIRGRVGGQIGRRRAITIARTETHSAASYANNAVAKESGVNLKKRWVSTNDERTREHHRAVNGQEVGMDEDFIVPYKGVDYAMGFAGDPRGGPANVINCRCVIVYFEDEDVVFDDESGQVTEETAKPQPQTKPKISLVPIFAGRISQKNKENMEDEFNAGLTPETARLVEKQDKPREIKRGKGWYAPFAKIIATPTKEVVTSGTTISAGRVLLHEYGHHIDFVLGSPVKAKSNSPEFRRAIDNDLDHLTSQELTSADVMDILLDNKTVDAIKNIDGIKIVTKQSGWTPKFEGAEFLSDVGDAIFKGQIYMDGGFGHGPSYFKKSGNRETEIFANIFALKNNAKAMETARKLFPNVTKIVEDIIQEAADV